MNIREKKMISITIGMFCLFLFSGCVIGEVGTKTKDAIVSGTSYVGQKSKSLYRSTKTELGFKEATPVRPKPMSVAKSKFGAMPDGTVVSKYTLSNANGMRVGILDYGGTVKEILAPDRNGKFENISLGFASLDAYREKSPYFGCITGRYANRIAKGKFRLEDKQYTLAINNEPNHLHGGIRGFDKYVWKAKIIETGTGVEFSRTSADGEEGYPGNLDCKVTYILTDENELVVEYEAKTDKPTVINLTNHTYFNLAGEGASTILDHHLMLPGNQFVATDETNIPTDIMSVEGTPLDFRKSTKIGDRIESAHPQIKFGKGYDHTWLVGTKKNEEDLNHAATLKHQGTGRCLEIFTDQPGIQFYSGNYLDGTLTGHGGKSYALRSGLCLETQVFPDSPNREGQKGWQSCVLEPGDVYTHKTIHRFFAE
jgi:aldose 1-epimerase